MGNTCRPKITSGAPGAVQHTFFNHQARASFFTLGGTFLSGLEDELNGSSDLITVSCKHFGRPHQDGDMGIMPAGMRDTDFFAVVVSANF